MGEYKFEYQQLYANKKHKLHLIEMQSSQPKKCARTMTMVYSCTRNNIPSTYKYTTQLTWN